MHAPRHFLDNLLRPPLALLTELGDWLLCENGQHLLCEPPVVVPLTTLTTEAGVPLWTERGYYLTTG